MVTDRFTFQRTKDIFFGTQEPKPEEQLPEEKPPEEETQLPEIPIPVWATMSVEPPTIGQAMSVLDELFSKPFAAAVTAPIRQAGKLELPPASSPTTAGVMSPVERGILSVLPGGVEREQYEDWKTLWGVKGAIEFVPWILMGGGPSKTVMQRTFGQVAKVEAKQEAGKVLKESEKQLLTKAADIEASISQTIKGGLVDIQKADEVLKVATKPDIARSLANLPGIKQIQQRLNPAAVAGTPAEEAMIARSVMREQGSQRTQLTMSNLWSKGNQETVFGKLDKSGLIASGELKGLAVNDIRTYPEKYANKLTPVQKDWIKRASDIEKAKLQYLKDNGIEIKELGFEEGGEYAGRKVFGKVGTDGEILDTVFIGAGSRRVGAKAGFEKVRSFKTAQEAIKNGYRYIPDDEALMFNVQAAYNRVADKRTVDWLLGQVKWRTTGAPEELILAAESAKFRYNRSKQLLAALNRAIRGERVPEPTIKSIERAYPNEAQQLRDLIPLVQEGKSTSGIVKLLRNKAKLLINADKVDTLTAVSKRARAREKALQVGYGEAMVSQPAFSGKIFTGPDAKEIASTIHKTMDAKASNALTQVNKVNAIARYFKLAGDVSPMAIQLLFLAGENPKIYGKAGVGFAKALFDKEFHATYLAKNVDVIAKNPDLLLTGMGTEFTEALTRGGLLRMKPFSWAGKLLTPFQKGFEVSLDVAGIEMAKGMEHLAKTPQARAELAAFINEFRGLASSARLGVSPQVRAIETAAILAPRYNRAIAALLFDAARGALTLGQSGGLRSRLAVRGLARGVAALSAMSVVVSLALGEEYEDIVEHFDPTSSRFFTWNIGGTNVGPGSKVRSVVKLVAQCWENPEALLQNAMENPVLRVLRGNLSPVLGSSIDILTGRNYIGDPVRDNALQFSKEIVVSQLLPIWVESVLYEGGSLGERTIRGAGEFFGGRAYPETSSEVVSRLRDRYSIQDYGIKYEEIDNQKQRDDLERNHSDLVELAEQATKEWVERGSKEERYYYNTKVSITDSRSKSWNKTAIAFLEGRTTNNDYMESIKRIRTIYSSSMDILWNAKEELSEYQVKQLEKWIDKNISPKDKAVGEYFDVRGQLLEQMPEPLDWDFLNNYLDEFVKQRYPEDIQNYINENKNDWLNDLPELPQKIEKMRYTDMEYVSNTKYWDFPATDEQRKQGLTGKQVIDYRAILREQDPQLDAILNFWYDYYTTVKTQEAMNIIADKATQLGRSPANIPAIANPPQPKQSTGGGFSLGSVKKAFGK